MTVKRFGNGVRPSVLRLKSFAVCVLIGLASTLALTSCATGTRPIAAPSPPPPPPPEIPQNLRQPCPELPTLTRSDPISILEQHDQETALYRDCKGSKARLDQAVNEWGATAWRWYCQAARRMDTQVDGCPSD